MIHADLSSNSKFSDKARIALPGVVLCGVITAVAIGLQAIVTTLFYHPWLEALVLAILLGMAVRTVWRPGRLWRPGIAFSAKFLLEVAIVLLGASVSAEAIVAAGPTLIVGIVVVVAIAIVSSYGLGRLFGLPCRMAILIACGNSICGNSAIAAVAPVIGADNDDVAASISFTAVLGVFVVLALPLLSTLLDMSPRSYGVFAGLTVYAVPQVLAATAPISSLSVQVGTIVKLVRVLMLGPVVLALSLLFNRPGRSSDDLVVGESAEMYHSRGRPPLHQLVPWFIVGFLAVAVIRSAGLIPQIALHPLSVVATWLTVISMAALGLGVDMRVVGRAGPRIVGVVTLSLVILGLIALGLIHATAL